MVITTRRDENPDCNICSAISCVMLVGFIGALFSQPIIKYEQLNWTTLCSTPGRELHSHLHGHHSNAHVVTPAYKLTLGYMAGLNLLYPHHFTHIYGCSTVNYNASAAFYVGQHEDSEDVYNDTRACINTFTVPTKNILIIYPQNESISISACGQHFLLDNNFQNYAEVQ